MIGWGMKRQAGRATAPPVVSRKVALASCPVRAPTIKKESKAGKLYVTVEFDRPGWQCLLGAERTCRRTFGLDGYGQEVYELCDGRTPTSEMVTRFAKAHHLSLAEAELSVTSFLKTLITKGLAGMIVSSTERSQDEQR